MSSLSRKRTPAVAIAVTALAGLAVSAAPAAQAANVVGAGHNVSIFGTIDFVGVFGYETGAPLTVDVLRGGHRIATVTAPAVQTAEGGGLEINHGPVGAAQLGDCWTNFTPDILPGDVIRVTDAPDGIETIETVDVDDIRITTAPYLVTADNAAALGQPVDSVVVEGIARDAAGAPIDPARLDSGEVRSKSPRVRANPDEIVSLDGVGGWRAIYRPPFAGIFDGGTASTSSDRDAILNGDHAMGYGHLVPLPAVTQLADGLGTTPGPALGCEGSPLAPASAVTNLDDEHVNLTSDDLKIGGVVAEADAATPIVVTVSDGKGNSVIAEPGGVSGGSGQRGWSATVSRAQLEDTLLDGTLTISTSFGGNTLQIPKDTVPPSEIFANPRPGAYEGAQFVTLATGDPTDVIRYRRDASDTMFTAGSAISVPRDVTLTATVTDRAGNKRAAKSFAYTILPPRPADEGRTTPAPVTQTLEPPFAAAPPVPVPPAAKARAPRPLALGMLVMSPRTSRAKVARQGVRVAMRVPAGTEVVRLRVYRKGRSGARSLLAQAYRYPATDGVFRVRLASRRLRRELTAGRYQIEVTPGRSRRDLGRSSRFGFRVTS